MKIFKKIVNYFKENKQKAELTEFETEKFLSDFKEYISKKPERVKKIKEMEDIEALAIYREELNKEERLLMSTLDNLDFGISQYTCYAYSIEGVAGYLMDDIDAQVRRIVRREYTIEEANFYLNALKDEGIRGLVDLISTKKGNKNE